MKKLLLLLTLLISTTAFSQCVIDGTPVTGTTKAKTVKSCDVVVQSLTNGMVKSVNDSLKTATEGVDYSTPATVDDSLAKYVKNLDETGDSSINSNERKLINNLNKTIFDWKYGYFNDNDGKKMFYSHGAYETGGVRTADFENLVLNGYSGLPSLTWDTNQLIGNWSCTDNLTADNLSGTNTGDQTTVSGNAGTATALQTPRNINGTSFNGTADITVTAAAGTLTGSTLNNTVTASSLTSFGSSPTLTTPNIGAATATSVNKVAITAPATSATLTIADGSTLATSGANSVTLTTTGTTNVTLPTSGTLRSKEGMVTNPVYFTDFINAGVNASSPYNGAAINSGTFVVSTASLNTLGTCKAVSSTTPNSGFRIGGSNSNLIIRGGEIFRASVSFSSFTNNTVLIGFDNGAAVGAVTNGIYFKITSSAIVLETIASTGGTTTSSTIITASANTFYKFEILINSNATSVTGNIYDVTGVTLLGTATITTNIPTTSSNPTNIQIIGTNSTSSATDIFEVDYMYSEFTVTR